MVGALPRELTQAGCVPHVAQVFSRARLDAIWSYELDDVVGDPFGRQRPRGE
jgi:hypothetical protein